MFSKSQNPDWVAGTGIFTVTNDCMNVEFERFMVSDLDYNIENGEVSDNHGLAIVQTSTNGIQLWSIDQAATTSWSLGNFVIIFTYSLLYFLFGRKPHLVYSVAALRGFVIVAYCREFFFFYVDRLFQILNLFYVFIGSFLTARVRSIIF